MRIFHIKSPDCSFEATNRFADLVSAFAGIGIGQYVLMDTNSHLEERFTELDIPFVTQKFSGLFDLRTQQTAQQIAESFGPHIIQTHSPNASSLAGKVNHDSLRVGFEHEDKEGNKKVKSASNLLLSVTYPQHGGPLDYDILPVPPLVINMSLDITPITKQDYNTPEDKPLIGTMLDLEKYYDIDKILTAFREISDVHFWIIGYGENKTYLEERVRKQAVHDKVRFIDGHDNWQNHLKALDFCIVPYRDKGTDRLTLEAWSCGNCVVSGMPTSHSPITDELDGILIKGNDAMQWRETIKTLIANKEKCRKIGNAGLEHYHKSFETPQTVGHYLRSYETALKVKI